MLDNKCHNGLMLDSELMLDTGTKLCQDGKFPLIHLLCCNFSAVLCANILCVTKTTTPFGYVGQF